MNIAPRQWAETVWCEPEKLRETRDMMLAQYGNCRETEVTFRDGTIRFRLRSRKARLKCK